MIKKFNKEKFLKHVKNVAVVAAYAVITVALFSNVGFAANNDLFAKAQGILNTIKKGLLALSTGAVVIAVACGVFMKKFSMGKQDKIEVGNKLIRDSIIGFIVLNSMTYITDYIMQLSQDADTMTSLQTFGGHM